LEAVGERGRNVYFCVMLPLSVLDLSPVTTATPPAAALNNTLDLARFCDGLGFARYWLAEHHNLPTIASSAPDIMIGQVAAVTRNMRVGSGGVMLPNHAPLMVMERFKVLEALFPGRIDLGLGRAPGTDQITSLALRRRQDVRDDDDFLERFQEMMLFESNGFPANHPFAKVAAMPTGVPLPPIWLLGSSGYSAELAAHVGAGFSFAHHFSDFPPEGPMLSYRNQFKPSAWRQSPYAILGVAAIAADTEAEADRMASSADLHFARRAKGEYGPLASPDEAAAYPYAPIDRQRIEHNRRRLIVGSAEQARERIQALADATKADEVMITTMVFDHAARKRSYQLLAQAFGLQGASAVVAAGAR
jgi:luciferase family oxidoreductase group 1